MSETELPEPDAWRWPVGEDMVYREAPPMHVPAGLQTLYTAERVRAAILAERERCAKLAADMRDPQDDGWEECLNQVAAAIRRGSV